ncbi:hypothetical protein V3C99_018020 [Haemonchus contortus]|uniref:Uncharacterized protein n=1 Tax=Haemonchus contortus TaxID=6289 RepID=A0A7I4Z4P8_HAECO
MEDVTTDNGGEKGIPHELEKVKGNVASLQREAGRKDETMEVQGRTVEASNVGEEAYNNQLQMPSTGQIYADRSRQHSTSMASTTLALEDAEFLRRFKRKYEQVIKSEATLIEISGDDHLAGRVKSIFAALPRITKEQGLDAVTREMTRLLSYDSTAGRMRALTELRNLELRPHQEVAEFWAVLEKLGRQANPECTIEDRSLE